MGILAQGRAAFSALFGVWPSEDMALINAEDARLDAERTAWWEEHGDARRDPVTAA